MRGKVTLHILQRHANNVQQADEQNESKRNHERSEKKRSADFEDCHKHKKKG
jgi:hypothetical protein